MPSTTSIKTTSKVPLMASHAAALAPTLPAPTTVIFLRIGRIIPRPACRQAGFLLEEVSQAYAGCNKLEIARGRIDVMVSQVNPDDALGIDFSFKSAAQVVAEVIVCRFV